MTDTNELLLTAAKLREQRDGELEGDGRLLEATGVATDDKDRATLGWLERQLGHEWTSSGLHRSVLEQTVTDTATEAVAGGEDALLSHLVGVTEQQLDGSALTMTAKVLELLDREGPTICLGAGSPETGKTGLMLTLAELETITGDNVLVLSNMDSSLTDRRVTGAHQLALELVENRDRPKVVLLDEGSTHLDARRFSREVATQFTPTATKFAKLGVTFCGIIGHTGKDVHPEAKRLTDLAFWKEEPTTVEFFRTWPSGDDRPDDLAFGAPVEDLEAPGPDYDPDATAPWSWDLDADLLEAEDWATVRQDLAVAGPLEG